MWCLHISKRYLVKSSFEKEQDKCFDGCEIGIFHICPLKREHCGYKKKKKLWWLCFPKSLRRKKYWKGSIKNIIQKRHCFLFPLNRVFKNQLLESHGCLYPGFEAWLWLWSLKDAILYIQEEWSLIIVFLSVVLFYFSIFMWPGFFFSVNEAMVSISVSLKHHIGIISVREFWLCYLGFDDLF